MLKLHRKSIVSAVVAAGCLVPAASALADGGPPPPVAANGNPVRMEGTGVPTPTAFAFGMKTVFVGSGPAEGGNAPTGLFTVGGGGPATKVPGTPEVVFGLAWHEHELYVSDGPEILAFAGWNGTSFSSSRVVSSPGGDFPGFNGIAFGRDGMLYAGVALDPAYDDNANPAKFANDVLRISPTTGHATVFSTGLRQPFQMTFVDGNRHPYVTALSEDSTDIVPKDAIVVARKGANFGFPTCEWGFVHSCDGFAKPLVTLHQHTSPMGIGAIGRQLYVSMFGGLNGTYSTFGVWSMPASGGKFAPFLTGFAAPTIGLGTHNGRVYVGDLTGTIYSVRA